jgi:hypothetical protein
MTVPQTGLEVIPYLEDSLQKVKDLIEDIIENGSLLKS